MTSHCIHTQATNKPLYTYIMDDSLFCIQKLDRIKYPSSDIIISNIEIIIQIEILPWNKATHCCFLSVA